LLPALKNGVFTPNYIKNSFIQGWGCSLVVENLNSMHEALGSCPTPREKNVLLQKNKKRNRAK
jgi:hypothetical protein